ncbi:MAG: Ferric reductase domain protein transmembrane component domain-containing protein, partial [Candidatus Shapirobacteria bacterium GW2011_GWE1_38_92]
MQKKKGNFIIMVLVILTLSLYLLSKADLKILWRYPWLSVSQMMSLVGVVLLSFTFVLGSRSKFLENWFGGLDEVNKKHQRLGKISYFLLLLHPLLLAVNVLPNVKAATNFLYLSQNNVYNFGVLALYL